VSTPVPDVIALYGAVARIADGAEAFVREVEAALAETPEQRRARRDTEGVLLERYSWDRIATEMGGLIADRLVRKRAAVPSVP
jgi:hypothetical protein